MPEPISLYINKNGRAGAYHFKKVWGGIKLRYLGVEEIGAPNEPCLGIWITESGIRRNTYFINDELSGTYALTKEQFLEKGGKLPEAVKPEDHNYCPPDVALGTVGNPLFWTGGAWTGSVEKFRDRLDRLWRREASGNWRLIQLADGTQWENPFSKIVWKDGMPITLNQLQDEGLEFNRSWHDENGNFPYIDRERKLCFVRAAGQSNYVFKTLTEDEWNPKGPYYTYNALMVMTNRALLGSIVNCVGGCSKFLQQKFSSCGSCAICKDCLTDHRHCPTCKRVMSNKGPAVPDGPYSASPTQRFCVSCERCFRCSRECIYCEPDKDKNFRCRKCCKGEHYEDEQTDTEAMAYILDYTNHNYPPARPPMVAKCEKCSGTGVIANPQYNPTTHSGPNAYHSVTCPICIGKGSVRNKTQLWMGVELEVEVPSGLLDAVKDMSQRTADIIIKKDSTIRHGFEVVTGPFSLEEHTKMWPTLSRDLIRKGCRSWNYTNTGLHVHGNWEFLSQMQLCMYNVWLNEPAVKRHIIKIAGRESVYAALKPKTMKDGEGRQLVPHREALNITTHRGVTFELRIFKGTLALEHILADIQFVHASVHWIKEATVAELDQWKPFWDYVVNHKSIYPELIDHFEQQTTIEKIKEVA